MKLIKYNLLLFCFLSFFSSIIIGEAAAGTYYVSTNGYDSSAGTINASWGTFAKAMTVLKAGDTLVLRDGTYYQSLDINVSGTQASLITIKAENDGRAIIDGQANKMPCRINGTPTNHLHDIVVEGIVCKNSNEDVIYIRDADRITLNRVSAYNAANGNFNAFSLWRTTNVTLTDCAASGNARKQYNILSSNYTKVQRCWGRWVSEGSGYGGYTGISIYSSNYSLIENCVLSAVSGNSTKAIAITGQYGTTANHNELYGNVFYKYGLETVLISSDKRRTELNKLVNNVGIDNVYGIIQRSDADLEVQRLTLVNSQVSNNRAFSVDEDLSYTKDSDFAIKVDVRNSVFVNHSQGFNVVNNGGHLTGFTNDYNNLYKITNPYNNLAHPGPNEISINPGFDTATYGKGAYLIVPAALKGKGGNGTNIGAEVLYRYQNGVLTSTPLWPWPMEQRICNETGYSVTYENGYTGCSNGGGLWKTLDGVYASPPPPPPPPPPTRPVSPKWVP